MGRKKKEEIEFEVGGIKDDYPYDTAFHNDLLLAYTYSEQAKVHRDLGKKTMRFPLFYRNIDDLDVSVSLIGMPQKCEDSVKRAGIKTISQLLNAWYELPKIPGCGVVRVNGIRNFTVAWFYDKYTPEQKKKFWKEAFR